MGCPRTESITIKAWHCSGLDSYWQIKLQKSQNSQFPWRWNIQMVTAKKFHKGEKWKCFYHCFLSRDYPMPMSVLMCERLEWANAQKDSSGLRTRGSAKNSSILKPSSVLTKKSRNARTFERLSFRHARAAKSWNSHRGDVQKLIKQNMPTA